MKQIVEITLNSTKIDIQHSLIELKMEGSNRLSAVLQLATQTLVSACKHGFNHWLLMFSGGKDSTATVIVALETVLKEKLPVNRIDVVYADTLVEIPVIRSFALQFLEFLAEFDRLQFLPLFCHVVYPALEERFWVCLLGKGYPPPHQRFRWCTKRLKIQPVKNRLKSFIKPNQTAIVTGVRFGESKERDRRLYASCRRGGECGQGMWFEYSSRLQTAYFAPLAFWKACDVWDFLNFLAPTWGYPTRTLEREVYNGRETRFGCWTCTVVRQDKTMEMITSRPEWTHLRPLIEFRERMLYLSSLPEARYHRPTGEPGRLSREIREQLLYELLRLQEALGLSLIEEKEIAVIKALWTSPRYGKY
ncbi:MAG: phosphoadenosine phosphosulfate reductase family protein [Candidatus Hadarchaeum sp.]